jgi:hypothetical protein
MCKEEERVSSNTDVMYIHVFHVSCRVVVMFTCTLVRSHPDSRGTRCVVGRGNKMHAHRGRPE